MRFLVLNSILVRGVAIVASDDLLTRRCPLEAVLGGSLLTPITMVMYTIFLVVPRRRYNLARLLHRAQMQSLVPARVQHDLLIAHLLFTFLLRFLLGSTTLRHPFRLREVQVWLDLGLDNVRLVGSRFLLRSQQGRLR